MIRDRTGGGNALLGSLRVVDGKGVVRMEDRFSARIEDMWSAITDPQRLARWIAQVEGDLRPGGEFRATFTSGMDGVGRIDMCEPPRRLLVTMSLENGEETAIEAVLAADGDHTRLVVEERGLRLSEVCKHGAGWQTNFEDLAGYLAGKDRGDWHVRWRELTPAYQELLAP